jgi:hypothetical protein
MTSRAGPKPHGATTVSHIPRERCRPPSAHPEIGLLGEIKAREKFNRRHTGDIPSVLFFAQRRYLSAFGGSGKLAVYG